MAQQGIATIIIVLLLAALALYEIAYSVPDNPYMNSEMQRIGVLLTK